MLPLIGVSENTTISGKVINLHEQEPLEFANVGLMEPSDTSQVEGEATDENGRFEMTVPDGRYLLRVTYMGFVTHWDDVTLTNQDVDIGEIELQEVGADMEEFTIEAPAAMFESQIDRRVFDVSDAISARGGNAIDLLETLPSIQVDEEGSISMRGTGGIEVHINGRPTNLTSDDAESILEQLPSDAIENVELITNPSARYDAEGVGGIINIVLKDDIEDGFSVRLDNSVSIGLQSNPSGSEDVPLGPLPTYNSGISISNRTGPWSLSASYSYQYRRPWEYSETLRENHSASGSSILDHDYSTMNYRQAHLVQTGADYEINDEQTIGVFANANIRPRDRERQYYIRHKSQEDQLDSMYSRNLTEDRTGVNYETGITYNWNINDEENHALHSDFTYSYEDQDRIEYFDERFINSENLEIPDKNELQSYERPINSDFFTGRVDYERPLYERFSMETGIRTSITREKRGQIFNLYENSFDDEDYITDDIITDDFSFDEDVHAAYFILNDEPAGPFSYQVGLRGEYTSTESYQPSVDTTHNNNYFDLFPSVFLNYELGDNHDIQASYSRRISRPGMRNMQPFFNAQDLTHLRYGNPYLNPEYTDNYDVSYIKSWSSYFLSSSVYYRHTTDALSRVYENLGDNTSGRQVPAIFENEGVRDRFGNNTTVRTWINANTERNLGVEFINEWEINESSSANLTADFFHAQVEGQDAEGDDYLNEQFSWSLNLQANTSIPDWFRVQASGNYRGPIVLPQGHIKPRYFVNIGLRRQVLDGQGTLSLSVNDIFNTRHFSIVTDERSFYQERNFYRESQRLSLSFNYRFERERGGPTPEELEGEI